MNARLLVKANRLVTNGNRLVTTTDPSTCTCCGSGSGTGTGTCCEGGVACQGAVCSYSPRSTLFMRNTQFVYDADRNTVVYIEQEFQSVAFDCDTWYGSWRETYSLLANGAVTDAVPQPGRVSVDDLCRLFTSNTNPLNGDTTVATFGCNGGNFTFTTGVGQLKETQYFRVSGNGKCDPTPPPDDTTPTGDQTGTGMATGTGTVTGTGSPSGSGTGTGGTGTGTVTGTGGTGGTGTGVVTGTGGGGSPTPTPTGTVTGTGDTGTGATGTGPPATTGTGPGGTGTGTGTPTSGTIVHHYAARFITGAADGDAVATLTDTSGNNDTATLQDGSTATYRAAQVNGLPAIEMGGPLTSTLTKTVHTVFVVARHIDTTFDSYDGLYTSAGEDGIFLTGSAGSDRWYAGIAGDVRWYCDGVEGVGDSSGTGTDIPNLDQWHVYAVTVAADITDQWQVGADRTHGRNWPGFVAEVIAYDSVLSDAARNSKTAELMALYGIGGAAPTGSGSTSGTGSGIGSGSGTPACNDQLTGDPIGTAGSYGGSGNTLAKALDGDLTTYFDAPTANGSWVGLDLGSSHTLTGAEFAPRSGFAGRMVGGQFQASDAADFSTGVTTLATIDVAPTAGVYTTVTFATPGTGRYVRYLGPDGGYCNVAEVAVFGCAAGGGTGGATVLDFSALGTGAHQPYPADYGSAAPATPDVAVSYGDPATNLIDTPWSAGLTSGLWGYGSDVVTITFTPAAGKSVLFDSFDASLYSGDGPGTFTFAALSITDEDSNVLWSPTTYPTLTSDAATTFSPGVAGPVGKAITLSFQDSASDGEIGINNVTFRQA